MESPAELGTRWVGLGQVDLHGEEPCSSQAPHRLGQGFVTPPATEHQMPRVRQVTLDMTKVPCSRNSTAERSLGLTEQVWVLATVTRKNQRPGSLGFGDPWRPGLLFSVGGEWNVKKGR